MSKDTVSDNNYFTKCSSFICVNTLAKFRPEIHINKTIKSNAQIQCYYYYYYGSNGNYSRFLKNSAQLFKFDTDLTC